MTTVVTNNGFLLNIGDQNLQYYNSLVRQVYDQYQFGQLSNTLRLKAVRELKQLFIVDFPQYTTVSDWFKQMLSDKNIDDVTLMVIEDTISYLKTGSRRLPIATYDELFKVDQDDSVTSISEMATVSSDARLRRNSKVKEMVSTLNEMENQGTIYYRWVSDETRFMDLVCFLKMILKQADSQFNN